MFSVVLKTKSGRERKEDGFKTRKTAHEFAERERANCPTVVSARVMENSEMSEADKRKNLKLGDPGYTGSEHDDDKGVKKLAEKTSEDFMDGHIHEITDLDESGNGKTAEASGPSIPSHSHEIKGGIVIPMMGGEGDEKYISYHPGEVMEGAEHKDDDKDKDKDKDPPTEEQKKMAEKAVRKFKEKIMKHGELESVEIFATGTHKGKTFDEGDLDEIIGNFDELKDKLKPPMVLGHDEDQKIIQNSGLPSLGWVTSLSKKDDGDEVKLVAHFDDVPEIAREVIRQGKYKRFSSEIYENYTDDDGKEHGMALRRVSLLGADIPEVKNLADVVALGEAKSTLLYCDRPSNGGEMNDKDKDKGFAKTDPAVLEQIKKLQEDNKSLALQLAKEAREKHVASISSFCEGLKREGRFLPRWDGLGIQRFMENLDCQKVVKFGEGKNGKSNALDFFMGLLSDLPKLVKLEEEAVADITMVAVDKGAEIPGVASSALDRATKEHMTVSAKAGRTLSYGEAVSEVSKARPELFQRL